MSCSAPLNWRSGKFSWPLVWSVWKNMDILSFGCHVRHSHRVGSLQWLITCLAVCRRPRLAWLGWSLLRIQECEIKLSSELCRVGPRASFKLHGAAPRVHLFTVLQCRSCFLAASKTKVPPFLLSLLSEQLLLPSVHSSLAYSLLGTLDLQNQLPFSMTSGKSPSPHAPFLKGSLGEVRVPTQKLHSLPSD